MSYAEHFRLDVKFIYRKWRGDVGGHAWANCHPVCQTLWTYKIWQTDLATNGKPQIGIISHLVWSGWSRKRLLIPTRSWTDLQWVTSWFDTAHCHSPCTVSIQTYSAMFASRRPAALKFKRKCSSNFWGYWFKPNLGVDFEKAKLRLPARKTVPLFFCHASCLLYDLFSLPNIWHSMSLPKKNPQTAAVLQLTRQNEKGCVLHPQYTVSLGDKPTTSGRSKRITLGRRRNASP